MRRGGKLLIVLGILLAIVSFVGIWWMMNRTQEPTTPDEVFTAPVVVAAVNIPSRSRISPEQITIKQMPLDLVPPMAVTEIFSVTDRFALSEIYADQIILHSMLADPETGSDLVPALSVPHGMVAMAAPINEITGVAEALRVGDHVDVIVALSVVEFDQLGNESPPEYSAQFTIQDVEVLHIGSWAPPLPDTVSEEGASSGLMGSGGSSSGGATCDPLNVIVLLLEPQDALVLKYAMDQGVSDSGPFTLVLRGVEDEEHYSTEAVNEEYMVQRFKFSRPPFIIQEKGQ